MPDKFSVNLNVLLGHRMVGKLIEGKRAWKPGHSLYTLRFCQ